MRAGIGVAKVLRMTDRQAFVVLSPHLDDAVLSVGAWLSRHAGTTVATACSGLPGAGVPAHGWDAGSGFSTGDEATLARQSEDANALGALGAKQRLLGFLDGPYRTPRKYHETKSPHPMMFDALVDEIAGLIGELQPDRFLFPLGWGHDDHQITSDAALAAIRRTPTQAIVYAELPYAIANPGFIRTRVAQLEAAGFNVTDYPTPDGDFEQKRTAWDFYPSQHVHLDTTGCFEPGAEHLFRVQT
jgi:LmbE family N-acetylglucosaminyl deacetylase